jgi:hypothetical protein
MRYALGGLVAVAALYGLHRLGLWAERRGWIYYRKKHGSDGALSRRSLAIPGVTARWRWPEHWRSDGLRALSGLTSSGRSRANAGEEAGT